MVVKDEEEVGEEAKKRKGRKEEWKGSRKRGGEGRKNGRDEDRMEGLRKKRGEERKERGGAWKK